MYYCNSASLHPVSIKINLVKWLSINWYFPSLNLAIRILTTIGVHAIINLKDMSTQFNLILHVHVHVSIDSMMLESFNMASSTTQTNLIGRWRILYTILCCSSPCTCTYMYMHVYVHVQFNLLLCTCTNVHSSSYVYIVRVDHIVGNFGEVSNLVTNFDEFGMDRQIKNSPIARTPMAARFRSPNLNLENTN